MSTLSLDSVTAAGALLVHEEGWSRLSLRSVAARLGVTPMALYRHVPNSEALSQGVIARIAEGFTDVRQSGDTLADLEWWARRAHAAILPYSGAGSMLLMAWFEVPEVLRVIERLLDVVYLGGMRDFEAVAAVNAVFMYVLMRAEAEQAIRGAGAAQRALKLAGADLPRLSALSEHYTTARFDLHFDYGLRVLLDGIAAQAPALRTEIRQDGYG
jgi:AcrR family transcriptional regulator